MSRVTTLRADPSGFSLTEVLIATVLLATAALATVSVAISATKAQYRAEQNQVAIDRAQLEIEAIRALAFDSVALTGAPPTTPAGGPGDRLAGSCAGQGVATDGCFGLNEDGTALEPLVLAGGNLAGGGFVPSAAVDPGPDPFTSGDVTGIVYRYVVWKNDDPCSEADCPGEQDLKRVIVVVSIDESASGGDRAYREVQTDFGDPDLGA